MADQYEDRPTDPGRLIFGFDILLDSGARAVPLAQTSDEHGPGLPRGPDRI